MEKLYGASMKPDDGESVGPIMSNKAKKEPRPFNFLAHPKRRIALKFFYYGWNYDGLVLQDTTQNTVERYLRDALLKTRLIESWVDCQISRCGRTDKGVSAFTQVVALIVRTSTIDETSFWSPDSPESVRAEYKPGEELPYIRMLNSVLPKSIRITAWARVPLNFSARHSCNARSYRYALPRANYDIEKMREAAALLVGEHDFRNFCVIDLSEERVHAAYVRVLHDVTIQQVSGDPSSPNRYDLLELCVTGSGFLWHMIRLIVGVLHEVGLGNESPQIVSTLLDISATPARPGYRMAVDSPLCLFDCKFEREGYAVQWIRADKHLAQKNLMDIQKEWAAVATRTRLLENMMNALAEEGKEDDLNGDQGLAEFVLDAPIPKKYIPFSERRKCDSLEEKARKFAKKRGRDLVGGEPLEEEVKKEEAEEDKKSFPPHKRRRKGGWMAIDAQNDDEELEEASITE